MTKYSILICDDERMIRDQIFRCAEELGCFEIYTAGSAFAAADILSSEKIEGMILDVRMPEMNGIDLLKELKRTGKTPVVYMLSGHDEPGYIRESLHYGVTEYLLKPLTGGETKSALKGLIDHIEKKRNYHAILDKYKTQTDSILPLLRNQFLKDILQRDLNKESIEKTEGHIGKKVIYPYMAVAVADIICKPDNDENDSLIQYAVGEMIASDDTDELKTSIFHTENKVTVIIFGSEERKPLLSLPPYLENKVGSAVQDGKVSIRIGIGSIVEDFNDLRESYSHAHRALEAAESKESIDIVDIGSITTESSGNRPNRDIRSVARQIRDINDLTDNMTFIKELDKSFESIKNGDHDINELIFCCTLLIITAIDRMDPELEIIIKNPVHSVSSKSTPGEILEATGGLLKELGSKLVEGNQKRKRRQADICRKIIERDYAKKTGVPEIAEEMGISSSYLSVIFKAETGYSINEYLTAYRLQLAKKLLRETDLKMYEIADQVGIPDTYYFSSVFKKNIGVSPSDYRNNH